jgi:hypothetical protein
MSKHANVWKEMQSVLAENRRLKELLKAKNDFSLEVAV